MISPELNEAMSDDVDQGSEDEFVAEQDTVVRIAARHPEDGAQFNDNYNL